MRHFADFAVFWGGTGPVLGAGRAASGNCSVWSKTESIWWWRPGDVWWFLEGAL